jgi:hypothetical protein
MAPTYRIERDRGSKEFPEQLAVLRKRWPNAFPTKHEDRLLPIWKRRRSPPGDGRRPPSRGGNGLVAFLYAWRAQPMENGAHLLPSGTFL